MTEWTKILDSRHASSPARARAMPDISVDSHMCIATFTNQHSSDKLLPLVLSLYDIISKRKQEGEYAAERGNTGSKSAA